MTEKTNEWRRTAHRARALPALPQLLDFESSSIPLPRQPVEEQDARKLAFSQRHRAGVYAQRDVLAALASAQLALDPKESALDRASALLRDLLGGGR